jgi:tetratricopeptide (TPR) repeat protein
VARLDREVQELIYQRNYVKAETLINDKIKKEPLNAEGYYLMGVCKYFQGQLAPSVDSLKKALELDPHHTDASICLSVLYNDIGKYEEAKRTFEQANHSVTFKKSGADFEVDRKFAVKHFEIADLYFRYRRYDEAIEEYTKALLLDPTALSTRIRRAKAYAKKGFLSRAMQELQQIKAEAPHYIPARIQLGLLHYSQGNLLDAELDWESILKIDPNQKEALAYLEMAKQARTKT